MRRTRGLVHHRLAADLPVILVIAVALLVSGAGLAVSSPREVYEAVAAFAWSSEPSVDRARNQLPAHRAARMAFVRATGGVVARLRAPSGAGTAGPRLDVALGAAWANHELDLPLASRRIVELSRPGVRSPGQPASSSRAPPIG